MDSIIQGIFAYLKDYPETLSHLWWLKERKHFMFPAL